MGKDICQTCGGSGEAFYPVDEANGSYELRSCHTCIGGLKRESQRDRVESLPESPWSEEEWSVIEYNHKGEITKVWK